MAPILSFTAEEAWRIVHPDDRVDLLRVWSDALPRAAGRRGAHRQVGAHPRACAPRC